MNVRMARETESEGRGCGKVLRWALVVACALLLGVLIGFCLLLVFDAAYWIINAIWIAGWSAAGTRFFPLLACTGAGLLLTLVVSKHGKPIRPAEARQAIESSALKGSTGGKFPTSSSYPAVPKKRSLPVRLADFFLPFAGGGPVGVAMGLIGFITSGSKWIKCRLETLCASMGLKSHDAEPSKQQKNALYAPALFGGALGFGIGVELFGVGMVIPRVEGAPFSPEALLWAALLGLAGWALGLIYLLLSEIARKLWAKAGRKQRFLPLACGIVLGVAMTVMPHAGLPGSDAYSYQLLSEWTQIKPSLLVATAITRVVLIAFLLNMGWSGGPFLPLIYCAICLGLGIAGASGLESGLCVASIVAGVLVTFSGQPFMGIAALMCCPLESIPVIAVASIVSSLIPKPKAIKGDFSGRLMGKTPEHDSAQSSEARFG